MELRNALLLAIREGFEINTPEVSLSSMGGGCYLIEVYDPLDIETQEPLDPTWNKCNLYKTMGRIGNFVQRVFSSPHEAVDFYLAIIEEARQ